jgi:polysaccharide pyruvyl transferase WcaK-like protein
MVSQRPVKRIAIFGHVGTKNLGDEAIIAAVIQQIRDRYPDAEIVAFTGNPEDTLERHAITSFPIRRSKRRAQGEGGRSSKLSRFVAGIKGAIKAVPSLHALLKGIQKGARLLWGVLEELGFLAKCYNHLREIDLLIFAGSNQLNDYVGGPWAFPYTLLKWCVLAKWARIKVAFLCCGAGPLQSRLGKLFIKYSLSLADSRSYRDEVSRRLIENIGVSGDNPVCTDLAYGLRLVQPTKMEPARSRLIVGINPLPFFDERYWPEQGDEIYHNYVRKLAAFARWLNERGHGVSFFPTQLRADALVIQDIRGLLKGGGATNFEDPLVDRPMSSLDDLISRISMMDIVVATRYHGILLAAVLHRPVLAIAYHEKTDDLMAQIGQSEYVVNIGSFDTNSLAERFVAMESRTKTIRREIEQRIPILRQTLEREYDRVFRFLADTRNVDAAAERLAAPARVNG